MSGPSAAIFDDGRLHLQHGPIDLIVEAFGSQNEVAKAYHQAQKCFSSILPDLAEELHQLRKENVGPLHGTVARRMAAAVGIHRNVFVTPMAAVAGSVADEVLARMIKGRSLSKAYVNNGGDIAFHLDIDERIKIAAPAISGDSRIAVSSCDPARGIATSGWRGRSHSLGIADAVTVLSYNASSADVGATLIANAVNLPDHPAILQEHACTLDPQSDLGERLVTTGVGTLTSSEVSMALEAGLSVARHFVDQGHIVEAVLNLRGQTVTTHQNQLELIDA